MQTSQRQMSEDEAHNAAVVLEYYVALCQKWNFEAASRHLGHDFVQHNPAIPDGKEGLRSWVAQRPPFADNLHADIKRVLVDGNFVVLHTVISAPGMPEIPDRVIADFFRLESHQVVEHWDVIQPVPVEALHGNGIA